MRTKITEALGIEHPIIQGGMHYVGYATLAAAVSNAGGLGLITALTQKTPELLRAEIRKCKALTNKPFGVNFTLLPALAPPNYGAYADVIEEENIPVVETAGRDPKKWIARFKKKGIYIIHKCVTVRHALSAQRAGADAISMDGLECGGHPGMEETGNWVLLALAAKNLDIPYVVSGGCANGRQLAAALMLGAEGMNMGTRFMATKEAPIHMGIKKALVAGKVNQTTFVMQTLKNKERVYKNEYSMKVREIEKQKPGKIGPIYKYVQGENYRKAFQETGDPDHCVWSVGQSMGLIDDIPTCKELIDNIMAETKQVMRQNMARL